MVLQTRKDFTQLISPMEKSVGLSLSNGYLVVDKAIGPSISML